MLGTSAQHKYWYMKSFIGVGRGGLGGLEPPQYFSGGGRAPPNILDLILVDI